MDTEAYVILATPQHHHHHHTQRDTHTTPGAHIDSEAGTKPCQAALLCVFFWGGWVWVCARVAWVWVGLLSMATLGLIGHQPRGAPATHPAQVPLDFHTVSPLIVVHARPPGAGITSIRPSSGPAGTLVTINGSPLSSVKPYGNKVNVPWKTPYRARARTNAA